MKRIAIFASGSGTNTQAIIEYFINKKNVEISLVLSNRKSAYVLERAKTFGIKAIYFNKNELYKSTLISDLLQENHIDLIVLAGFLLLVPANLITLFPNRIINIHPALLPKYGGKGMYGMKVHESVIENSESESGISIHYVNRKYDEGELIFQSKCKVENFDNPESLAEKIHKLEHKHYPKIIEEVLNAI